MATSMAKPQTSFASDQLASPSAVDVGKAEAKEQKSMNDDPKEDWTEEQLESALRHLKFLHIECRGLLRTIPRMTKSISEASTEPEAFYADVCAAMSKAVKELADFKTLYTCEESRRVLAHATRSREAQPMGIMPWRYRDHPNWCYMDLSDAES